MSKRRFPPWRASLLALGLAAAGLWALRTPLFRTRPPLHAEAAATSAPAQPARNSIGCSGRFAPDDPVVRVAAPYFESRPSVVTHLLVREGQWVKAGQPLAWLDGKGQLEAVRARAVAELDLAQRHVTQVRAGARASEIAAQRADIALRESAYQLAIQELRREERLAASGDIPAARLDRTRTNLETTSQAVKEAQHRLAAMTEVRPEDLQVAESEVGIAQTRIAEIDARLAVTTVAAPASGRIIRIHAHPSESAGENGILDLADTRRMAVEAEVYASDIALVRPGQNASIEVEGAPGHKLAGQVARVGARVRKPAVLPNEPAAYSDAHVVPVHIRIAEGACGDGGSGCPIDGRVRVVIDLSSPQ